MDVSVNKLSGLEGDKWMRHANPVSVWTRFAVLPLLALALLAVVSGLVILQTAKACSSTAWCCCSST
jgi:hypothetical protein